MYIVHVVCLCHVHVHVHVYVHVHVVAAIGGGGIGPATHGGGVNLARLVPVSCQRSGRIVMLCFNEACDATACP